MGRTRKGEIEEVLGQMGVSDADYRDWRTNLDGCLELIRRMLGIPGFNIIDSSVFESVDSKFKRLLYERQRSEVEIEEYERRYDVLFNGYVGISEEDLLKERIRK